MSQPLVSSEKAACPPAVAPANAGGKRAPLSPLHFELARALPPLWRKARTKHLTAREQHSKMLELLVWVAEKKGYITKQRQSIQYWQGHVKKDGRVDLHIMEATGPISLIVEMDWSCNGPSIHKLQSASIAKLPVLWISGVPFATKEDAMNLRVFANESTGKPTSWWLPLFHLEHGWL